MTELVDFVEQEQRIAHADLGHILQNLARHRADISAAMPANFSLIAHATQRHAHELAVSRTRDRLTKRSLAHAWRADQTQNRCLEFVDALLHRQILDDPLFDFFQAVVVGVEHFLACAQIGTNLGFLFPRQVDQGLDVVAHDRCLSRHRRHQRQLLQFGARFHIRLFRHARGFNALFQLCDIGTFIAIAEFFLNRFYLFVEVILALTLLHLPLHAPANALFYLEYIDF